MKEHYTAHTLNERRHPPDQGQAAVLAAAELLNTRAKALLLHIPARHPVTYLGFRALGLGFRVLGLGFRVLGLGLRV